MTIKIQKLNSKELLDSLAYKNQKNVRRCKDVKGGFDKIVYATDQD